MSSGKFGDDFRRDAVAQLPERGYPVREVSHRLGVGPYSLYAWMRKFAKASSGDVEKDTEIRGLKRESARVAEERDILENRPGPQPACARWKQAVVSSASGGQLPIACRRD